MSNPIPNDAQLRTLISRLGPAKDLEEVNAAIEGPASDNPVLMALIKRLGGGDGKKDAPPVNEYVEFKDVPFNSVAGRNKNPGNLRGQDGRFRQFDSVNEGFDALVEDIQIKQSGRSRTGIDGDSSLIQFFSVYAPPNENRTVEYAQTVAKTLGVTLGTPIRTLDPVRLAHAIARFEDRPYYEAVTSKAKDDAIPETVEPPIRLTPDVARPDVTGMVRDQIERPPEEARRITEQNISPAGIVTTDIESRRAFLERQQAAQAEELPPTDTIGPAPTGVRRIANWLGNMRFLTHEGVLSSRQTGTGIDVGGLFRFGDQVMTPILRGGDTEDFAGGMKQLVKTGGGLALGIADMFVGAPAKLIYNEAHGQDYLLPEERELMFKQTLANYGGLFVGLSVGKAFAGRGSGWILAGNAEPTMAELAYVASRPVATGWRARAARGAIEGLAGGGATGFIEAEPGKELDLAVSYALMSVPLGIAFEAVASKTAPVRYLSSDEGQRAVARDMFHLRQLALAGDNTGDQAAARIYSLSTETDLARALIRSSVDNDEPAVVRAVDKAQMLKDLQDFKNVKTSFFRRSDNTWDVLIGNELSEGQHAAFKESGFFGGEPVSYLGKDYEYIGGVLDQTGKLVEHRVKDASGTEFNVLPNYLEHGYDIARSSITPDRARVRARLYKDFKAEAKEIFDDNGNIREDAFEGNIDIMTPFNDYVKKHNIPPDEYNALSKFLQSEFEDDVVRQALPDEEYKVYQRLIKETESYRAKQPQEISELASAHGMYLDDARSGGMLLRDRLTNEILNPGPFHSAQSAREFILSSAAAKGAILDGSGFPTIGSRFALTPPEGSETSVKSKYNFMEDGVVRQVQHYINTSQLGRYATMIRQVMIGFDAQQGTRLSGRIWYPLQEAFRRKHAAMHEDVTRIAAFAHSLKGMTAEEIDHIISLQETRSPQQIIDGELVGRPLTHREIAGANWFVKNRIDIRKAFEYRRAAWELEKHRSKKPMIDRVRELQARMNVDETHVRAAEVIGKILQKNDPQNLSLYAVVRLAEATMGDHLSPVDYIKKHNLSGRTLTAQKQMEGMFKEWATKFDIPEARRLMGYFAHMRRYSGDIPFSADPSILPEFVHNLQRTGEMYEYNRNPVDVMMRYINMGYNKQYVDAPWNAAMSYLDGLEGKLPNGKELGEFVKRYYMYELRGVPHDSQKLTEGFLNKLLNKLGINANIDARRHVVNMALSLTSTKYIGFRPMQGIRDVTSIIGMHWSRFGTERTTAMLNIISQWTPEQLVAEGILKEARAGEGVLAALQREGVIPTLSPVQVLSGGELLSETLAGKTARVREITNKVADAGLKWGLQHNAYQWGHGAVYLEAYFKTLEELNNLAFGKYGQGEAAKIKAYRNLTIDQYDVPVAQEFDRFVRAGKFADAAKFLANASSTEVVAVLGHANQPAGWGTTGGRLFAQFGNWPTQMRSTVARLGSRGSPKARAAALARFAASQAAITATGAVTGLAMGSWYLPYAGTIVNFADDLGQTFASEDSEETWGNLKRAAARGLFGITIGSTLYTGGPFVNLLEASSDLANAYEGDDARAVNDLVNNWLIGAPVPLVAKDFADAAALASEGYSPFRALARALGIRTQKSVLAEEE